MRVALLAPDIGGKSGWSRYALDLGRALNERGHEIHCITATAAGAPWCTEYPVLRQPTSYLGSTLLCRMGAWKLSRTLRHIQPDIVHVIAEPYALLFPLMKKGSWKNILTIHGTYSVVPLLMRPGIRALAEKYYRGMDRVIAVSEFTKRYLGTRMPYLADVAERVTVIHNAITLMGITADTEKRPAQRDMRILSVSAVKRKKGYVQSLRAIRRFIDQTHASVLYDIVGNDRSDPAFTDELRALIADLNLSDVVRFRGRIDDQELDAAYREADLFLLPSLQEDDYFEGFGLVFIEANARGTPCIGGDTGGCPEAINDGVSGYVCAPEQTENIAARMADILINGTIDRAGCRKWAEEHDVARAVEAVESTYAA